VSYPRKLQILVVEDEQPPIDGYQVVFGALRDRFPHADPVYVRSYADARVQIESPRHFHVIILDLNLPIANRDNPEDGLAPGESLLEMLAQRDAYPVPVVLVVSGRLSGANLPNLRLRLARDFWHGEFVNKGSTEAEEIRRAFEKAHEYCDVGVHIRSSPDRWYPTLSPREDDLLRRCVLTQTQCLGVDLEWWGAEEGPSLTRPPAECGPTSVLMGHFLLDGGLGTSIPTFFKFEPAANAPFVCRDTSVLAHKLGHVKLYHADASRTRCLLVTQSVTNRGRPTPLSEFLRGDPTRVTPALPGIVGDVVTQLGHLGDATEVRVPLREVLWKYLNRDQVEAAWARTGVTEHLKAGESSPMYVFDQLAKNTAQIWVRRRACIHGDLNATNVAVDPDHQDRPQAYIFDAAGMNPDLDLRDLATLEVTTLLFNSHGPDQKLLPTCRQFYQDGILPAAIFIPDDATPLIRNTVHLIAEIRKRVSASGDGTNYALVVFNAVLMQLFGLTVQPSRNKITHPLHASLLASWAALWLRKLAPDLATSSKQPIVPPSSPEANSRTVG